MSCSDYSTYAEFWTNFQPMDGVLCPFTDQLGMPVFAMFAIGALAVSMYVYTDNVALPLALGVILTATVLVELPAAGVNMIALAILIGLSAPVIYILIKRD